MDPEEVRRFAKELKRFNDDVQVRAAALHARLAGSVFLERSRQPLTGLPDAPPEAVASSASLLDLLVSRLAAEGLEVLFVDCSPPGGRVRAVKVIVPGLEIETMSYHRIGWRGVRRLRQRNDPLVLDAPRAGAKPVLLRQQDAARAGGPAWFDGALADRLVGSLYPLYREPGTFSAQRERQRRQGLPVPA